MSIEGSTIYSDTFREFFNILDGNTSASRVYTAYPIGSVAFPLIVVGDPEFNTNYPTMHAGGPQVSEGGIMIDIYSNTRSGLDIVAGQVKYLIDTNRNSLLGSGLMVGDVDITNSNDVDLIDERRIHMKTFTVGFMHGE